jgi:glycosyltransferase involved in cell wall biosynthesis
MRVLITSVQAPFIKGGAESHAVGLLNAIREAGHEVDIVTTPFRYEPPNEIIRSMKFWEEQDFTSFNGKEVDAVICLKFPTFYLRHPRKILWLLHQHRPVYDLWDQMKRGGHRFSWSDRSLRRKISRLDNSYLSEISHRFTNSSNVSKRLMHYNGIEAKPLYHPPPLSPRAGPHEPFVFCPSRVEFFKRQEMLLGAVHHLHSNVRLVFAGGGSGLESLRKLTRDQGLENRVEWVGPISDAEMLDLYSRCLAVFFGPYDEDYGYVTLEAMQAAKPVITCTDSGGPLEFVRDEETGFVVEPKVELIAKAMDRLASDPELAQELGNAGLDRYKSLGLSWSNVVQTLLG